MAVKAGEGATGAKDVVVNGKPLSTAAATIAELVAEFVHSGARVATARNGDFVPESARAATGIEPGDHIEILSPRHGG